MPRVQSSMFGDSGSKGSPKRFKVHESRIRKCVLYGVASVARVRASHLEILLRFLDPDLRTLLLLLRLLGFCCSLCLSD